MLEQEDISWVHTSLVELLKDEQSLWRNETLDRRLSEVLELIHKKASYQESEEYEDEEEERCRRQREKLKKKA
jgi:hypothetical protein